MNNLSSSSLLFFLSLSRFFCLLHTTPTEFCTLVPASADAADAEDPISELDLHTTVATAAVHVRGTENRRDTFGFALLCDAVVLSLAATRAFFSRCQK